jgi:hypothetical protein
MKVKDSLGDQRVDGRIYLVLKWAQNTIEKGGAPQ